MQGAFGWTSSGFHYNWASWRATDVVVTNSDGVVEEIWAGGVNVGDVIDLEQFGISSTVRDRPKIQFFLDEPDIEATEVVVEAKRLVLFLRRTAPRNEKNEKLSWKGAISSGARYSVVWCAKDKLWCWQSRYMWDSMLHPLGLRPGQPPADIFKEKEEESTTFQELKTKVSEILLIKASLAKAAQTPNPAKRSKRLSRFVTGSGGNAHSNALKHLSKCGVTALPVFRELLFDSKLLHRHSEIMTALVKSCGKESKSLLMDILKDEKIYWEETHTLLESGWGKGTTVSLENSHHRRLEFALLMIGNLGATPEDISLLTGIAKLVRGLPRKERENRSIKSDANFRIQDLLNEIMEKAQASTKEPTSREAKK